MLIGFLGQLTLTSLSAPGEAPRRAIQRLMGIDIASAATPQDGMAADNPMAGMAHLHHGSNPDAPQDDGTCLLCPLLHLPLAIVCARLLAPLVAIFLRRLRVRPNQPRAPPALWSCVASPRGPPAARALRQPAGFAML
ncbi:DUF2946 family protein [Acetobacter sp. P1H12_c]|uniref:DUF2946 family protein n=1 Tax=Acetobacter sp. P1H12_c TaxID=2762621 RepID=UPI00207B4179|nr:DUF2946 family protein [Acetobacter sp. P1H12_c]